jgi:hypothetical protein
MPSFVIVKEAVVIISTQESGVVKHIAHSTTAEELCYAYIWNHKKNSS